MNSLSTPNGPGIEILESRIAPAVLVVSNLNDNGPGSLRTAIGTANSTSGDRIIFKAGLHGTLTLASALPTITAAMSIAGPGANLIKISGAGAYRIFDIDNGSSSVDAPVAMSGLSILDGHAVGPGGGIFSTESLTLARVIVSGDTATLDGGGVYIHEATADATVKIGGSIISGNTAGLFGGGIFEYGAHSMSIATSTVSGNSAGTGSAGGGIYAEVNTTSTGLSISRSKFTDNQAKYAGGLLLNNANGAAASKITLSGLLIAGNEALNGAGGGMELGNSSIGGGTVDVIGGVISGNTGATGGGIYSRNLNALTISGSIIKENASTGTSGFDSGGGLFVEEGGVVTMTYSQILDNTAAKEGGGISVANGTSLSVIGCIVSGNKANAGDGGGVCALNLDSGVSANIKAGLFSGNTSAGQGGGLYFDGEGGSVTIAGARVDGNTSHSFGGGGMKIGVAGTVTVEDSSFIGNGSSIEGGGLDVRGSTDMMVTGCILRYNTSENGGGLYLDSDMGSVLKTTISANKATVEGGGVDILGGSITLQKGLVTGNTAPMGTNIYGTYTAS